MNQTQSYEVDGVELTEGDTLWRLETLTTSNKTFEEQDPEEVIQETAETLVENCPEVVNGAPVNVVAQNLKGTPGIYDRTEGAMYQAMEVYQIATSSGVTEVRIKDFKEGKKFAFKRGGYGEQRNSSYYVFEPMSALEKHLNVTLLRTELYP